MNEHDAYYEYLNLPERIRHLLDTLSNLRKLDKKKYSIDVDVGEDNGKYLGTITIKEK